jgi:uncharacterized membrane protein SpoIIM required for sporulation
VDLSRFLTQRSEAWQELDGLVIQSRHRAERLGPEGALRLGALYRSAAADLALARREFPGDPFVGRLEQLVLRSRSLVYDAPTRRRSLRAFFSRDYWRLVADKPLALLVAFVLLFAPAVLSGGWALRSPGAATGVVPAQFRPSIDSQRPWQSLSSGQQAAFTTEVFTNNIEVTLVAFAGGVTLGLLTAAILIFNGVILGAVGGLMIGAGNWRGFLELVSGHGFLELSCILVAGAAGLRVGWSIVAPGHRTRAESVKTEARAAVALALGTAPWLVAAGIVEGNRARLASAGVGVDLGVGVAIGLVYWSLVLWRGRPATGARASLPADRPERRPPEAASAAPR